MKQQFKVLLILLSVIQMTKAVSQNTIPDTVFVKKTTTENQFEIDTLFMASGKSFTQVLVGTTFLPYSDKMASLLNNGLSPISLEVIEECDDTVDRSTFNDYPKFLNAVRDEGNLTIDVSVIANCCHNFLGEAEAIGKDTLNLVYTSYGGLCSCECCFTLRYTFETTLKESYQLLRQVTINGSEASTQISIRK